MSTMKQSSERQPKRPAKPDPQSGRKNPASGGGTFQEEFNSLRDAALAVQKMRAAAQHELQMARKLREDAQKYQQETATRARSEAQQLVLKARLSTQREIEELVRKASEEIQKVLADIRIIRITAQEELAAQRKFTDAARLCSMSVTLDGTGKKSGAKGKKQLASSK